MAEEESQFFESAIVQKFDSELVEYVRMRTGIQEPDADTLRRYVAEKLNGGTTP